MDKVKVSDGIMAHSKWVMRLHLAIETGKSEFNPATVKTDNVCDFGKWLYSDFQTEMKGTPLFIEIKDLHAKFHQAAGRILELALSGKKAEAIALMGHGSEFKTTSSALILKLTDLKRTCA